HDILENVRVLIVDDNEVNREILHNHVAGWGMRNDTASSGEEALSLLKIAVDHNDPYKVVLLDLHMPGIDGLELARRINLDDSVFPAKLIMLSSAGFDSNSPQVRKAGISRYITKPVRQHLLLESLRQVMGESIAPEVVKQTKLPTYQAKILLAEDNYVNQEVAIGMLMSLGCDVHLADNGLQAVESFSKEQYDMVFMDCHMPEMNGFDASAEIRDIERIQDRTNTPIIALTADVNKGIQDKCSDAGMNGYVSKPFSQTDLIQTLNHWLNAKDSTAYMDANENIENDNQVEILVAEPLNQLRKLGETSGRDVIGRAVRHYLEQTPADMAALQEAATKKDFATLNRIAHSLKSASANLGALQLSQQFASIEQAALDANIEVISSNLSLSEALLPKVLLALRNETGENTDESEAVQSQKILEETILLVDDDAGFRLTATDVLEGAGFNVWQASSGQEALEKIRHESPDLILLDAVMDNMDGFETCRSIIALEELVDTPVLMVTGLDDLDSVDKAFDSGASGFITKPVNFSILLHRIRFQLRAAENAKSLKESQKLLSRAQRMARIGFWRWNSNSGEFFASDNLLQMLSVPSDFKLTDIDTYLHYIHHDDRNRLKTIITEVPIGGPMQAVDYKINSYNGDEVIVHQVIDFMPGNDSVVVGTVQDITKQHSDQQKIRELAYFDNLTQLSSRAYFYLHIDEIIKQAKRNHERFGLLYIDIDNFKDINDSFGHDAGDKLLQGIADRFSTVLRETDFAARLSGDEFCIIADNITEDYAAIVANRCLAEINQPIDIGVRNVSVTCSIGIAHFPDDGEDAQSLLKAADSALYAAKGNGRHQFAFYQPELTQQAERRFQLEQDLRVAIESDQLMLYYQPQIDSQDKKMIGVEALVRWNHPEMGIIFPDHFIEVAERIGVIKDLGNWVIRAACEQMMKWHQEGLPLLQVAVNISPLHFSDPSIVVYVENVIKQTGIPANKLELEITESCVQINEDNPETFTKLRKLGVKIAIDDFGTGYSSLASLRHLQVDTLKVDKLFVDDIQSDTGAKELVHSIIDIAHNLGHVVVAEGVEEKEQQLILDDMKCDTIQGYFFSKPVPAEQISVFFRSVSNNQAKEIR
ncbi:MAG: EAL domain-containing protein, partial [Gammaproteobacteria bacterium]|nr:EAL domain-containing protein [Gammaproteobacteria bacterium]